jgi:hypothetical protein
VGVRRRLPSRPALVLSAVVLCGSVPVAPAAATAVAATDLMVAATAATWGAVAALPGDPTSFEPLTLTWTTVGNDASGYFDVVNVGSLPLRSQTLAVTVTVIQGGSAPDPIAFDACIGAVWDATTGTCAGSVVTIGTSGLAPFATGIALAPADRLSIRTTTRRQTANRTITTIDVRVTRIDVRDATGTSS